MTFLFQPNLFTNLCGFLNQTCITASLLHSTHQNDFVVETSLVGTVFNGLSHLNAVTKRGQFIVGLLRGLGGNLNVKTRKEFAKEVRTLVCFCMDGE